MNKALIAIVTVVVLLCAGCGVSPPTIDTQRIPNAEIGTPYLAWIRVSGGGGEPYAWALPSGSLPPGFIAEQIGRHLRILGNGTTAGEYAFKVEVIDKDGRLASRWFQINVYPALEFLTSSLPAGNLGQPYDTEITAIGGAGDHYFGFWSGDWPPGLNILTDSGKGVITGTPQALGTFVFELYVSDSSLLIQLRTFTLVILPVPTLAFPTPPQLPSAVIGFPYSVSILAVGGSGEGYQWSLLSGALPDGLTLAGGTPAASIAGTPTGTGTFAFTLRVEDSDGYSASKLFSLQVQAQISISTATIPNGLQLSPYSTMLAATGGSGTYSWSVVSGALPAGVSLGQGTPAATLSGTPTEYGSFSFTVRVQSSAGDSDERGISFDVLPALAVQVVVFPDSEVGTPYSRSLTASGGTNAGYQWSIAAGGLPDGLVLDSTGTPSTSVHGIPAESGQFNFTVQVQDSAGNTDSEVLTLNIYLPVQIITTLVPEGESSTPYSTLVSATGGTAPFAWDLIAGALPSGFVLASSTANSVQLHGSTGSSGEFNFTLRVTSATGSIDDQAFTLRVTAPLVLDTISLPNGVVTQGYLAIVSAHGGSETGYVWTLDGGVLPPGLSFPASATPSTDVSGTPTIAGAFTFTLRVTDSGGRTKARTLSVVVDSWVTTAVGTGEALGVGQLSQPGYMARDSSGNLYVVSLPGIVWKVNPTTGTMTHYAGDGLVGFGGDGGPATSARFWQMHDLCVGPDDDLYVSDSGNYRIRKVDHSTGVVTTVVGSGVHGFSGDGGNALAASISSPGSITFDASGNLYFADDSNNRIRRVDRITGIITTIAGNGTETKVNGVLATNSGLGWPSGIAADGDAFLYLAEQYSEQIRRINLSTGIITAFAGNGQMGFTPDGSSVFSGPISRPLHLAIDSGSNVIYAESGFHRVRSIDSTTGVVHTVAGSSTSYQGYGFSGDGGPGILALLSLPRAVCLSANDDTYFCDSSNARIRKVDALTGFISTVAGHLVDVGDGGPLDACVLKQPSAMAFDNAGRLLISTEGRIRRVDFQQNIIEHFAGQTTGGFSGDGQLAINAQFQYVGGIACAQNGDVYVADTYNHRIRKITAATGVIDTVAGTGVAGNSGDAGQAINARLNAPRGLRFDNLGRLLIADTQNHRIRRIDLATGIITKVAGGPTPPGPVGLGDGGQANNAYLNNPHAIDVDGSGNIYIADSFNHRIRKVTASTGIITTVAGSNGAGFTSDFPFVATEERLSSPRDVVVGNDGRFYIMDEGNRRVRYVDPATGLIRTLAGGGTLLGDNGPGAGANFEVSLNLILGPDGCIYVADTYHNRIRKLQRVQ